MQGFFQVVLWALSGVLTITTLYGLYHVYVSSHMFGPPKLHHRRATAGAATPERTHRFAVVTCAKNEEPVIDHLLQSLHAQDYPSEAFDVFVVADNCTDRTAEVARAGGAKVYERSDDTRRSKGYALNWFFPRFFEEHEGEYDACVMFDADNVVTPGFLTAMNRQLNAQVPIATGYRMGKNPTSSWTAGCSTLFWLMQSRAFHVPRSRLDLPCVSVGGTGFMFDLSVLPNGTWHTTTVCEDIEFTLNSIAAGHFVGYAPDAIFYDEQPLTFMQSVHQRYRWALGSLQVAGVSTPRLAGRVRQDPKQALDAFMFSLGAPVMAVSTLVGGAVSMLTLAVNPSWVTALTLAAYAAASYVLTALFAVLVLRLEKVSWRGAYKTVLTFPAWLATWGVIVVAALFYRNTHWRDIPHVVSVSIHELSGHHQDETAGRRLG